jgi:HEAT repeat protein
MPIVPSPARRIHDLVARLGSARAADRDSAVAQLTLLGGRVLPALAGSLGSAPPAGRLAAVDVLDRLEDPAATAPLLELAGDRSEAVARRALEALGGRRDPRAVPALRQALTGVRPSLRAAAARSLARVHGAGVVEALSPLVEVLLDEGEETRWRLEVLDAVLAVRPPLPAATLRPLARRVAASPNAAVARGALRLAPEKRRRARAASDPLARLASSEVTPDEAETLAAAVAESRPLPLRQLHEALEKAPAPVAVGALAAVLASAGAAAAILPLSRALARLAALSEARGRDVLAARVRVHAALAELDSRIALHDLRELVADHPPETMPSLLRTAARVGDASLVPALARAASEDASLLAACTEAFRALARRHRLRRTSPALRRVPARHRAVLEAFLAGPRRGPR